MMFRYVHMNRMKATCFRVTQDAAQGAVQVSVQVYLHDPHKRDAHPSWNPNHPSIETSLYIGTL